MVALTTWSDSSLSVHFSVQLLLKVSKIVNEKLIKGDQPERRISHTSQNIGLCDQFCLILIESCPASNLHQSVFKSFCRFNLIVKFSFKHNIYSKFLAKNSFLFCIAMLNVGLILNAPLKCLEKPIIIDHRGQYFV